MRKRCSLKSSIGSDFLLLSFIQIVTYGCTMLITKLLSMTLTKAEYGTYATVMLITNTVYSMILLGLPDSINYFYNMDLKDYTQNERESYVNTIFAICFSVGFAVSVILAVCSGLISDYFNNPDVQKLVVITCTIPCFENAVLLYQTLYVSAGKARVIAIRNLLLSMAKVLIVSVSLIWYKNLTFIFSLNALLEFVQFGILWAMFSNIRFTVNPFRCDYKKIGTILKYGLPMGIYAITNTLMRGVDKLVIGRLESPEALALYTNCSKLLPINLFVTSFATVLIPYITRYVSCGDSENATKLFKSYIKIGYMSIWMFSAAIIVCAKEIIPFLYSDAYLEGLSIFIIYVIDGILQFASMHLVVAASGNTMYIMILSASLLGVNLVLDIVMYYICGCFGCALCGPAIATCIVTLTYAVMILNKSRKVMKASYADIFDFKHVVKYVAELFATALIFAFIRNSFLAMGLHRYLFMVLCCVGYCIVAFAMNAKEYIRLISYINQYRLND